MRDHTLASSQQMWGRGGKGKEWILRWPAVRDSDDEARVKESTIEPANGTSFPGVCEELSVCGS